MYIMCPYVHAAEKRAMISKDELTDHLKALRHQYSEDVLVHLMVGTSQRGRLIPQEAKGFFKTHCA